jgi:uncharacterized membrane protein YbhN (UPF0104 family)
VIWRFGSGPFLEGIGALDGWAFVAAAAIIFVTTVCFALRWKAVADGLGVPLSLGPAVAAYYRALFLNLTLPGGVAGDVHRGVRHGREAQNMGHALRAVAWERSAGQAVQLLVTIPILFLMPSPLRSAMPFVALGLATMAAVVVLVVRVRTGSGPAWWQRARQAATADIRRGLLNARALPTVVLASALAVVGHLLTFVIAARVVGVTAPLAQLVPLAVISIMAMTLPNIGGWGPREGVTAWAFSAAGLGAGLGAATAVAYGVIVLVASLPGGLVLLLQGPLRRHWRRPGWSRLARPAPTPPQKVAEATR